MGEEDENSTSIRLIENGDEDIAVGEEQMIVSLVDDLIWSRKSVWITKGVQEQEKERERLWVGALKRL